jgi:hypothetical protein
MMSDNQPSPEAVEDVSVGEFMRRIFGARYPMRDLRRYEGYEWACLCGRTHRFVAGMTQVLYELDAQPSLIVRCPDGGCVTCVRTRGLFRPRLASTFGTRL